MFAMKKLLSIVACLSLSLFLTGCGGEKKVDKTETTKKIVVEKDGKSTTVEEKDTKQKTTTKDSKDAPVVPEKNGETKPK